MPDGEYPSDWKKISEWINRRARGRCECTGHCALHRGIRCAERQGKKGLWMNGKIMLTVAHLNHYPPDCQDGNLLAMCQRCHLRYDQNLHRRHLRKHREERITQEVLPLGEGK